jgi:hypothetical protein
LQILGYPISGSDDELRPGHRRYNFGWYRVADSMKLREMCNNSLQHEFSVPPPLLRKDLVAQMRAEAEDLLPLNSAIACVTSTAHSSRRSMTSAHPV